MYVSKMLLREPRLLGMDVSSYSMTQYESKNSCWGHGDHATDHRQSSLYYRKRALPILVNLITFRHLEISEINWSCHYYKMVLYNLFIFLEPDPIARRAYLKQP